MSLHPSDSLALLKQAAVIPALVTPFVDAPGQPIDEAAFERLVARLLSHGTDALLVNGTTAESPTLTLAEKQRLIALALQQRQVSGQIVPIVSGVSGNATVQVVEEAQTLAACGVDALLVVVPYYNKPMQEGLYQHFSAVAQAVAPMPIILYNIPGRCVVNLEAPTVARLVNDHDNIIGIKQSNPDMEALMALRQVASPERFSIWCGDDALTLPFIACGAVGTISVLGLVALQPLQQLIRAVQQGDWPTAQALNEQLLGPAQGLFALPNPTLVKAVLARQGLLANQLRLPMVPIQDAHVPLVNTLVQQLNILSSTTIPLATASR